VAERYLSPLFAKAKPTALVLGCTHFPVLASAIRAVLPPGVTIIDSAATTAAAVLRQLAPGARVGAAASAGCVRWLATDGAARFARVGTTFLGETLGASDIEIVDL